MSKKLGSLTMLILLMLLVGGCQPLVAPGESTEVPQFGLSPRTVQVDLDFSQPEWGVTGWLQFEVTETDAESNTAMGRARWVELNEDQALRYVIAEPKCVAFSEEDGAAFVAVQITDRYGWGEGQPGEWMTFWFSDAEEEFSSPLWPPGQTAPSCVYASPPYTIPALAGGIDINGVIAMEPPLARR